MANYNLGGKDLTQAQVDTAYSKGTVDQRAMLNQKLGLSYDVNTGKASQYQQPVTPAPTPTIPIQPPPVAPVTPTQPEVKSVTSPVAPPPPVSTPQPTTTPPVVEKTTTTTPQGETVVKKETPQAVTPDYNIGKGREAEIQQNLSNDLQDPKTQEMLNSGNRDAFNAKYGYATADDTKKHMLDSFFQSQQPQNSDAYFSLLGQGMKLQKNQYVNLPEARDAQHRFDVLSPYKGASTDTIYNAMVKGTLVPGSQSYNDLIKLNGGIETSEMLQAKVKMENKQKIDSINRSGNINGAGATDTAYTESQNKLQTVSDDITKNKGMDYATEFQKDVVNNPEIKKSVEDLNAVSLEIKNLEDQKALTMKNIVKQYPGITTGAAMLLANQQNESINETLNQLYNKQSVASANLTYQTNLAQKMFDYKIGQYQEEQKNAQQIASEERQFGRQKELAQFQQQLGLDTNQAEFEQQMAQQAQIASDPIMATQQVIDTYAKLGILPERSNAEIIQSVQNDIAGGMTLGQSLTNLNKAFQSKPQYQATIAPKTKDFNPNIQKIGENDYGYFDSKGNLVRVNSKATTGGSWMETIGDGKVTFLGGRVKGDYGMDIAGPEGFDVTSPVSGTILTGGSQKDYGTYVEIKADDGSRIRLSHLSPDVAQTLQMGGRINAGDFIGKQSNTGTVIARKGRGVLDVTTWGADGKVRTGEETQKYLGMGGQAGTTGGKDIGSLGQYMKDNQETGVGYSNEDVKRFDAKIDRFVQAGDEEGMAKAYRGMLMKDKDFKQEFDNTQKFVTALDSVQNLVNEYEKAGKSTNAAKAFAEKIARGLGMTTDTALAQLQTQMGFTLANYIRSISGTAASDTEVQRLMGNMAQLGNVKDLNTAIVSQAKNNGLSGLKSMIDTRMYGMPEDLKPKVFGDIYKQEGQKYTTDQGDFTEEEINQEVQNAMNSGESIENIKKWLKANNIPFTE